MATCGKPYGTRSGRSDGGACGGESTTTATSSMSRPIEFPDAVPELVGSAVVLRELVEADTSAWFARATDAESADLATGASASARPLHAIASGTKTLTSIAVCQLVEPRTRRLRHPPQGVPRRAAAALRRERDLRPGSRRGGPAARVRSPDDGHPCQSATPPARRSPLGLSRVRPDERPTPPVLPWHAGEQAQLVPGPRRGSARAGRAPRVRGRSPRNRRQRPTTWSDACRLGRRREGLRRRAGASHLLPPRLLLRCAVRVGLRGVPTDPRRRRGARQRHG